MEEPLTEPPGPEGDDQLAKTDDDTEIVTLVDFLEAPELDEDDVEDSDDDV